MEIDASQDTTRPFVPRPNPFPIPTPDWNSNPVWCLRVNDEWGAHILGVLEALAQRDTWIGTDAEVDAALDSVNSIIDSFVSAVCQEENVSPFIVGEIRMFAHIAIPDGWEFCYGQTLSRTTFADLFAAIGTTYGAGDGSTTFAVPFIKRRFPAGYEPVPGGDFDLGHTGGEESHALTADENGTHSHEGRVQSAAGAGGTGYIQGTRTKSGAYQTATSGLGSPHENRPPYIALVMAIYSGVMDA